MDIIITGAERSGTTMMAKHLGAKLEPKETIAEFMAYKELLKWKGYHPIVNPGTGKEKHSLNLEHNIYLLEFLKIKFSSAKFIYMLRDGRDVIKSMYIKEWGFRLRLEEKRKRNLMECIEQWNTVIDRTFDWAQQNAEIKRYEDLEWKNKTKNYKEVFSNAQIEIVEFLIGYNLKRTGYD